MSGIPYTLYPLPLCRPDFAFPLKSIICFRNSARSLLNSSGEFVAR